MVQKDANFAKFLRFATPNLEDIKDAIEEREAPPMAVIPKTLKVVEPTEKKPTIQPEAKAEEEKKAAGKLITSEARMTGSVKTDYYMVYIRACGVVLGLCVVLLAMAAEGIVRAADYFLSRWTSGLGTDSNDTSVQIYVGVSLSSLVVLVLGSIATAYWGVSGARTYHRDMLKALLGAPISFFDKTPSGRIINRFSNDMNILDRDLPPIMQGFLSQSVEIGSLLVVICVVTKWFILPLIPIGIAFYVLQLYYRHTSRELKRIDNLNQSPLFIALTQTLDGLATIRAYNVAPRFQNTYQASLDMSISAYMINNGCNWWLSERLDILGSVTSFAASMFVVGFRYQLNAGLVGLAVGYTLTITSKLNWFVRQSIELEQRMSSIERFQEYIRTPSEEETTDAINADNNLQKVMVLAGKDLPADWPADGAIKFNDISMRYRAGTPLVIKHLDFSVKPGERVGLVGRSGAGKSSITNILFRIVECEQGSIEIDGIDIRTIPRQVLRSRMSIIPQDPVLFTGTVRYNLDPFAKETDEKIWEVLGRIRLSSVVNNLPKALDSLVAAGGSNFSAGERQLMCLGRALLRNTKIVLLDEATASVDGETDALIQKMIRTELLGCTVLTIAHRLETILDYDKVVVLDDGVIIEMDSPAVLMANPNSHFFGMVQASKVVKQDGDGEEGGAASV